MARLGAAPLPLDPTHVSPGSRELLSEDEQKEMDARHEEARYLGMLGAGPAVSKWSYPTTFRTDKTHSAGTTSLPSRGAVATADVWGERQYAGAAASQYDFVLMAHNGTTFFDPLA